MIATPVASRKSSQTDLGRCSPAEMQRRRFFSEGRLPRGQHGPVGGGGGGQHGHAVGRDRVGQFGGRGPLDEQRGRARPEGEQQQAAQPEGEAERGSAGEHVVAVRLDQVVGEGVTGGQHVAVEVHGHLGLPGGARGGREHGHVVGRGEHRGERAVLGRAAGGQGVVGPGAVAQRGQPGRAGGQVGGEALVADGQARLGQPHDGGDLPGTQQGHGGDRHPAGLDHGQPGRGEPGIVRAAEQDPVTRLQAEVLGQHLGQLVRPPYRLAVRPGPGGERRQGRSSPSRAAVTSSSSAAQFSRSGYLSWGRSKRNSGHWSCGGSRSRQKVSACAEGESHIWPHFLVSRTVDHQYLYLLFVTAVKRSPYPGSPR